MKTATAIRKPEREKIISSGKPTSEQAYIVLQEMLKTYDPSTIWIWYVEHKSKHTNSNNWYAVIELLTPGIDFEVDSEV